ncbi:hypothetical protein DN820_01805 [Stutzerimonas nosocomialis]|uniref:Uncharacterized protein n=1 Tax=Stutzerimonas nosocomialis TaxID=1056496 RepID=A0A5R9QJC5_9GAMM|nr:hypothetical protein [Stutzerimonas nosocomialis]TLX65072.1 hypothetical protein DN820_01805 [Stutzerimonas nosocomialis]
MTNPIEQAHAALIRRLERITPNNGYLTDAGYRVREGWLEELLTLEDVAFPFVAVQPGEYLPPEQGPGVLLASIGRRVVGVVDGADPQGYLAQLDALYCDLLVALQFTPNVPNPWGRPGPYKVTLGTARPFPPGSGLAAGTILLPLQLQVITHGE